VGAAGVEEASVAEEGEASADSAAEAASVVVAAARTGEHSWRR
jgi:hypothetical protein